MGFTSTKNVGIDPLAFSSVLAVSNGISDSLTRMRMRKQDMEMSCLVQKVQTQLRVMDDVILELQNEHRIKSELLPKQILETKRVKKERDTVKRELNAVHAQVQIQARGFT